MSNQNADATNAGKSGGHNMQGQNISVAPTTCGSIVSPAEYKRPGVSNGGK